jgi:predicted exporter
MNRRSIAIWLAFIAACLITIAQSRFTTDLSAFLPRNPTPAQQLLLEQIRDGLASRLILVGIEGGDAQQRAELSIQIAKKLRADPILASVSNGEDIHGASDRAYLFEHRYLLSPSVTPSRFEVAGLHDALSTSIDLIASPAGLLFKSLLPHDATGEMAQLLDQMGNSPRMLGGAWASKDGKRALMLVQTRASGSDTDAQQRAMAAIRKAFDEAHASGTRLLMTGPGVFSVNSRETIRSEVTRLSILSIALIAALLLLVYRSFTALMLSFLPIVSGALSGIASVSLAFGTVHGITLGFGTALIGEAVDYSIYLFVQSGQDRKDWIRRFWPTVRLGVLTSIFGFAALMFSGFPGLAQLGLYATSGLVTAALVTRFVLPQLMPANFRIRDVSSLGRMLTGLVDRAARLTWPALLLLVAACAILFVHRNDLWNEKISSLSPVSQSDVALDTALRADLGAPDVRYMVVVSGKDQESVLQSAEHASDMLQKLVEKGELSGFESPSRYLPSIRTQRMRQNSLPDPDILASRLSEAVPGLPVKAERFAPFLSDVEAARHQPLLQRSDLENTSMSMAVDALLIRHADRMSALLPLTAATDIDAAQLRSALKAVPGAMFVDMKAESDHLYSGYLHEVILLSLGGTALIVLLLLLALRSFTRMLRIVLPLAAAVITVTAGLTLFGQQLIIMHLVGLLLVVAVGSNYALFFDRGKSVNSDCTPKTLASMLFANSTAVAGFGLLAFSKVSILQAIGVTVAPGVILALIYSAIFSKRNHG